MKKHYFLITDALASFRRLTLVFFIFWGFDHLAAQTEIGWQKTAGTSFDDDPLTIITNAAGDIYAIGNEPHVDFTGLLRPFMMITKLNPDGQEIWKIYHDVAFNTISPPSGYFLSGHFFTKEFETDLLNLVIGINNQTLLYKIDEATGAYFYSETIPSPVIDVDLENGKTYGFTLCSIQQSCYGHDSLVVERFDPTPDSLIFNPIVWTFGLKQNIRTAAIQGHYDFDVQDIRTDAEGNTYLLVQIERWDFQFCTDCADAFVDAWCEVFKLDPQGQLVRHVNLKTAKAVVSHMTLVDLDETSVLVQIDDINASGTKVITSLYRIDRDLDLIRKFDLDQAYTIASRGSTSVIYAVSQQIDPQNPAIHGLTDIVVSTYQPDGVPSGKRFYGGSSWDFIKGVTLGPDGFPVILARSDSDDFDVLGHIGGSDMWIVKLAEEGTTGIHDAHPITNVLAFPNPCQSSVQLDTPVEGHAAIYDQWGRCVHPALKVNGSSLIDMQPYAAGLYHLQLTGEDGKVFVARIVKQE